MEEDFSQETVKNHILAAAKLVAVKMFAGLDISKPVTLSGNEVFDVINNLLKENYKYSVSKYTFYFIIRRTMVNVAGDYGIELILS